MDINRLVNAEGVSDHTALLPTKNKALVDFDNLDLSDNAKKVLALIYNNLEEATSEPYRYEKTTVTLSYGGEIFKAIGVRNLELGWKKNRPDETVEHLLPAFHKGDRVPIKGVSIEKQQTKSPERFTDGKLLQTMESAGKSSAEDDATYAGIGTAATRADTIEKLITGVFATRIGEDGLPKSFAPTELARYLCQVLPDVLKSSELTADWETKLSEVEKGTMDPKNFLEQIKDFTKTALSYTAEKKPLSQVEREELQGEAGYSKRNSSSLGRLPT